MHTTLGDYEMVLAAKEIITVLKGKRNSDYRSRLHGTEKVQVPLLCEYIMEHIHG